MEVEVSMMMLMSQFSSNIAILHYFKSWFWSIQISTQKGNIMLGQISNQYKRKRGKW